jgi:hypothetical protein
MTVKQRMFSAANMPGLCETCSGHIAITKTDFDEAGDKPTRKAQFAKLKEYAKQGAESKCKGCIVVAIGDYNEETLDGEIECLGTDANGVVGNSNTHTDPLI